MSDARTPTYEQLSALCAQMAAALDELLNTRHDSDKRNAVNVRAIDALKAHAALSPDPQWQKVPEGSVVVPINPTMKMLAAAQSAWVKDDLKRTTTLWAAMLGARGEG